MTPSRKLPGDPALDADTLDRLEALAAAATPGPWMTNGAFVKSASVAVADTGYPTPPALADAAYIAALDPATVQQLVAAARLGAAWQAAEAALPEGWRGPQLHTGSKNVGRTVLIEYRASVWCWVKPHTPTIEAFGPTPAAALLSLAEALRGRGT